VVKFHIHLKILNKFVAVCDIFIPLDINYKLILLKMLNKSNVGTLSFVILDVIV